MISRLIHPAAALALLGAPAFAFAQSNDECSGATVLKSLPSTRTLAVHAATANASDPEPSCSGDRPNVWFTYKARTDVSLELDATASGYRAEIAVYTGDCGALTEIACNDRSADGGPAHLVVLLHKNQAVRIAVTTDGSAADKLLTLVARKSHPRYRDAESRTEILRSSDPSPYGGGQGFLLSAVARTEATTAFAQDTEAIVVDVGGVLTTIAHSGSPTPLGGTFVTFHLPVVAAADVYFSAEIDGGPVSEGIFKWNGVALQTVLRPGDPGPAGTTLRDFRTRIAVSESGLLAFLGRTQGDGDTKLMLYDGATVTLLAADDQMTPCGNTIRSIDTELALDTAGTRVVFVANVRGVGDAVLTAATDGGGLTAIACADAPTPLGGTYRAFGSRPAINDLGEVYFMSTVAGGVGGEVVWVSAAGVATAVATEDMVLATGQTIRSIPVRQQLATNAVGDVVFVATLAKIGRAIVRRAHLAPLPSTVVLPSDPCPTGGTFGLIDDELDVSAAGDIVFDADCGSHGAFQKPLGGAVTTVASVTTATAIGAGLNVGALAINGAGTRVAGRGFRVTLQALTCTQAGCTPPVGLVDPRTPLANVPGQFAGTLFDATLAGNATTLGFVARTAGVAARNAVLRLEKGKLDAVASVGDTLPGGVGTFADFETATSLANSTATIGVGTGVIAFRAGIEHPDAAEGIFAATSKKGLTTIALAGDPAPGGDVFDEFSAPTVRGRSVVFVATTTTNRLCIFATAAPGRTIATIACVDDAVPAPGGGLVGDFLALPVGTATDLYVPVEISQGERRECLLRYRNGTPSVVRCQDDVYLGGSFYDSFAVTTTGPFTDAKGRGLLFVASSSENSASARLLALRRDTLFPLLVPDVTVAPLSGGTISEFWTPTMAGKAVVVVGAIRGGGATSALFRLQLP